MTAVAVSAQLGTVTVETQDCLAAYAVIDAPGRPRRVLQFGALVQRQAIGDRLRREGLPVTDLRGLIAALTAKLDRLEAALGNG